MTQTKNTAICLMVRTRIAEPSESGHSRGLCGRNRNTLERTPLEGEGGRQASCHLQIASRFFAQIYLEFLDPVQNHLQLRIAGSQSWPFVHACIMTGPQDVCHPEQGEASVLEICLLNTSADLGHTLYHQIRVKNLKTSPVDVQRSRGIALLTALRIDARSCNKFEKPIKYRRGKNVRARNRRMG